MTVDFSDSFREARGLEESSDTLCTLTFIFYSCPELVIVALITNLVKTPTLSPSSGGEMEVGGSTEGRELLRVSCPFVLWKLFFRACRHEY